MTDHDKEQEVVFRCQLWIFQEDEQHIRARLNESAVIKSDVKKLLALIYDKIERQLGQVKMELTRLKSTEENMRRDVLKGTP